VETPRKQKLKAFTKELYLFFTNFTPYYFSKMPGLFFLTSKKSHLYISWIILTIVIYSTQTSTTVWKAGGVIEVVEHLLSKPGFLSSNSSTEKKKKPKNSLAGPR
jgi:hypothetical protein